MTENLNVAIDKAECIKPQSNIGGTVCHNICDGSQNFVPWGSADWLGAAVVGGLLLGIIALLVFLAVCLARW